jgi:hypothetical protein
VSGGEWSIIGPTNRDYLKPVFEPRSGLVCSNSELGEELRDPYQVDLQDSEVTVLSRWSQRNRQERYLEAIGRAAAWQWTPLREWKSV